MTHFSDTIRQGAAGMPGDPSNQPMPKTIPLQGGGIYGAALAVIGIGFDSVPIASFSNNLAAAATVSGTNWTLTTGTGITATSVNGVSVYDLQDQRSIVFLGATTTNVATLITVSGFDRYQMALTSTFSGPTGTGVAESLKTFRYVAGVFSAGNTVSAVSIGTGDSFGLNHVASSYNYIVSNTFSGNPITSSVGFTRADVTNPATSGTGDVRGKYKIQSVSANGTARLTIFQYLPDTNTVSGVYGVTQA